MRYIIAWAVGAMALLAVLTIISCGPGSESGLGEAPAAATPVARDVPLDIISVLPKDAIRAILEPEFLSVVQAVEQLSPEEPVLGVSIGGDHRAYPLGLLNRHEIVNDVVGGAPLAVTW